MGPGEVEPSLNAAAQQVPEHLVVWLLLVVKGFDVQEQPSYLLRRGGEEYHHFNFKEFPPCMGSHFGV